MHWMQGVGIITTGGTITTRPRVQARVQH